MKIREAQTEDIRQIQIVRNAVKENTLSNPDLITDGQCQEFITIRGKGWVCEIDEEIVGFSIVDLQEKNIWALFLKPENEKKGIGRQLHDIMLNWYFLQTRDTVWLSTTPGTRAESFYRKAGWTQTDKFSNNEIYFEMSYEHWIEKH
ncbi:MAG: GNAT family N-acetyltransferase [Bacteroidia bacterium]|nr:GNAT family N-acetyltransferase [Bacteroidia bacterium]